MNFYKKINSLLVICLLYLLSSCRYNKILYNHLSDKNNYYTYSITINNFYCRCENSNYLELLTDKGENEINETDFIYFAANELDGFDGGQYLLNKDTFSDYIVLLRVVYENYLILEQKDFFENYQSGDSLEVKVSRLIYMDTNYYFISSINYCSIEYLSMDVGLENIIKMMDKNRSVF